MQKRVQIFLFAEKALHHGNCIAIFNSTPKKDLTSKDLADRERELRDYKKAMEELDKALAGLDLEKDPKLAEAVKKAQEAPHLKI